VRHVNGGSRNRGTREQGNKEHGSKKELSGDRFYLGSIRNIQHGRKSEKYNLLNSPDFQVGMGEVLDPVFNGLDFCKEAGGLCGDLLLEGHDGLDFFGRALMVLGIGEEILADHLAVVPLA